MIRFVEYFNHSWRSCFYTKITNDPKCSRVDGASKAFLGPIHRREEVYVYSSVSPHEFGIFNIRKLNIASNLNTKADII